MNDINANGGFGNTPKFKVFELISATNATFLANIGIFARAGVLPVAVVILLALAAQWMAPMDVMTMSEGDPFGGMSPADLWLHIGSALIGFAILMAYTVACHRHLILGAPPPVGLGISFGGRELKFIAYTFLVGALLVLASMVAAMPMMVIGGGMGSTVGIALNITLMGLLFVRLSLVFPAIAADQPGGLIAAWTLSRGHTFSLLGAYIALYVVFFALMILPSMAAAGTSMAVGGVGIMTLFNTIAQFISAAYFATMLSLAYKVLAANGNQTV